MLFTLIPKYCFGMKLFHENEIHILLILCQESILTPRRLFLRNEI